MRCETEIAPDLHLDHYHARLNRYRPEFELTAEGTNSYGNPASDVFLHAVDPHCGGVLCRFISTHYQGQGWLLSSNNAKAVNLTTETRVIC